MKPKSHELDRQHAFDSFCKKVLRNDARNYYGEMKRLRDREASFSELSEQKLRQLSTTDRYFEAEQIFTVSDRDIIVNDENIAEALRSLPEDKRYIILLHYFLDFSDVEIGKKLNLIRSTVQYQRTKAVQELRRIMEGNDNERKDRKK